VPGIGAFISPGRSLEQSVERARRADEHGYASIYTTQIAGRDAFIVLAEFAHATENVKLGTGVAPIFARTPAAMAQVAATLDEVSSGRMVLGLGVSHRVTVENWYGAEISKPVSQMRDYAGVVRAILTGEQPPESDFFPTRFQFMGYQPRPDVPIYIAALSPNMLQLAGEIGDGVMLWLCDPDYIRNTVIPEVTKGREKVGKSLDGFDIVAAVPTGVTDDREAALNAFRQELIPYSSLPFYRAMLESSGFADDIAAFDAGMAKGDVEKAKAGLSERMLDSLAGIGSPDQVRAAVERYREAGAISPCIGGIPGTGFDDALDAVAELI
jgi:alkanesulfonate monooxygenase SsuD/methylene tetrahydromethanopterin reductase-like flavin-dependent oxidoreductase (luciferase family)